VKFFKQSTSIDSYYNFYFTLATVRQQTACITYLLVGFLSAAPSHHLDFCFFLQNKARQLSMCLRLTVFMIFYYRVFCVGYMSIVQC